MASILAVDKPVVKENFEVDFVLPNKLMKDQLKRVEPKLLKFVRESLNNFSIKIELGVNETLKKDFAYTPLERYNQLKNKNPFLEKLNDQFKLDL